MPGSVKAAPDRSLLPAYPQARFSGYNMTYTREGAANEYNDGSSQRAQKASESKRQWRVSHRLSAAELVTFRSFWKAHLLDPFRFVDRLNSVECKAVFTGSFQETWSLGQWLVSVVLLEVE